MLEEQPTARDVVETLEATALNKLEELGFDSADFSLGTVHVELFDDPSQSIAYITLERWYPEDEKAKLEKFVMMVTEFVVSDEFATPVLAYELWKLH
jgi:hypothetical protein